MYLWKTLLVLVLALVLSVNAARKKEDKENNKNTGSGNPYGGPSPGKKSLMNRACRATWICGDGPCIGVDDQYLSQCNGDKNCKADLKSWTLTGANKQWGTTATQYKADYNFVKKKNCEKMLQDFSGLEKDIKSGIKDMGKYGYKIETKGLDTCDIVSRICLTTKYGRDTIGFDDRCFLMSVNPNAKKFPTGAEKTRTYFRSLVCKGKTNGFVSAKQH